MLDFLNLAVEALDVVCQKFDVVFAVLECFELQVDELIQADLAVLVGIHLLVECLDELLVHLLPGGSGLGVHEVTELFAVQVLVLGSVRTLGLVVLVEGKRQVPLKQCVVLTPIRLLLILVSCAGPLPAQHLIWIESIRAVLHCVVVDGSRYPALVCESGR